MAKTGTAAGTSSRIGELLSTFVAAVEAATFARLRANIIRALGGGEPGGALAATPRRKRSAASRPGTAGRARARRRRPPGRPPGRPGRKPKAALPALARKAKPGKRPAVADRSPAPARGKRPGRRPAKVGQRKASGPGGRRKARSPGAVRRGRPRGKPAAKPVTRPAPVKARPPAQAAPEGSAMSASPTPVSPPAE